MPTKDQAGRNQALGVGVRGLGSAGSSECICPKCGYKGSHKRGMPCNQIPCPKCGTNMKGENCK